MGTSKEQAIARARSFQDDTRFDRFRGLRIRRASVVVTFVLLAAAVAAFWADLEIVAPGLAALALISGLLLRRVVRLTADAPDEALDERLIAVRNASYLQAYRVVSSLTVLALLVLSIAVDASRIDYETTGAHLTALFWGFLGVSLITPTAVVAWTQPEI